MKIVIHGATHSTNFGDLVFARLFYSKLIDASTTRDSIEFLEIPKFGIGDFCAEFIGYKKGHSFISQFGADALIMMSGGYLGDNHTTFKQTIKRYVHYVLPARMFQLFGKPVYVIGVGGGPVESLFLQKACVKMLNKAKYVSVRDEETKAYFDSYGVKNNIVVTTDTAQVIDVEYISQHCAGIKEFELNESKKHVFLHIVGKTEYDAIMAFDIVPALIKFLETHEEYDVIIGNDEVISIDAIERTQTVQKLRAYNKGNVTVASYKGVYELLSLLNNMDFVITPKLHVGIISAALNKSVVSFPIHQEKTERYYRQIGEAERSIHISKVSLDVAYRQFEYYYNKPIKLDETLRCKANDNLNYIDYIVQGIKNIQQ